MDTPPCLPYAALRDTIHSGDLLLCSGSSPMSRMIQAATESPFSHVGFLLRLEALERIAVLESVESIGIRACMLSTYVHDYNGSGAPYPGALYVARHAQLDLQDTDHLHHFARTALDLLGYPYGTRDILDITARIVGAKLGMAARPMRTDKTFICSEFVALVYATMGVHIPYDVRGFVAPADFAACPSVHILWEIDCSGTQA